MRSPLFFTLFLLTIALVIWYVSRRFAWALGCKTIWPMLVLITTFITSGVGAMGFVNHATDNRWGHISSIVFPNLMGILLILVFCVIMMDLVNLAIHMKPSAFCISTLALCAALSTAGIANAYIPAVKHISIETGKNAGNGIRIVQLTDMHLGHNHGYKHVKKIVDKVNRENPDIVVITGDLFDSYYRRDASTISAFRDLNAPVFFVDGNHDGYVNKEEVKDIVRSLGNVRVLENEVADCNGVRLVGLNYMPEDEENDGGGMGLRSSKDRETVRSVMERLAPELDTQIPVVVLHHVPCGARYMEKAGADLFLSGHTHGGQFYPLIWINDRNFEYNRGLYKLGKLHIYVSCGTGCTGPQLRLGTRPEIAVLDLR
ncbi:MAG: metallophosphoesterase [Bacteroidales bacterium]|nr:metallophosphoesterase [Candidatus Cryptobacteroides caccocaballi]